MFGRRKLSGVFTAVVTPFDAGQNIDLQWMRRHLAFQREAGVDGVVVCGTNGEGQSLSFDERCRLIEFVRKNRGGLRVIAATGSNSLAETVQLNRRCARAGVDAALVLPPYFDRSVSEESIARYFTAVADRSSLPIILYNIPALTGIPVAAGILRRVHRHKRIVGMKDSAGDPDATRALIREFPKLSFFCGDDRCHLQALQDGASGLISGHANVFPFAVVDLWRAFSGGEDAAAKQQSLRALVSVFEGLPARAATKYALELAGMPRCYVRPPADELTHDQRELLRARLNP